MTQIKNKGDTGKINVSTVERKIYYKRVKENILKC